MPPYNDQIKDKAWADFQKWVDLNDPAGLLTMDEQIEEYAADQDWKKKGGRIDG